MFGEMGCTSSYAGGIKPSGWSGDGVYEPTEQADHLEAVCRSFWNEPWWAVFYWRKWDEQNVRPQFLNDPEGDKGSRCGQTRETGDEGVVLAPGAGMDMKLNTDRVLAMRGLVCFWDFQEPEGHPRQAKGAQASVLREPAGVVATANEGVFGPRSVVLGDGPYFSIPRGELGRLNIHGPQAQVSVVAWLKRRPNPDSHNGCQAVAGIWNEHAKRQYCLFLNLRIWNSAEQVGAHISGIGGATPGYKYCMDAAIGATPVPFHQWVCCAISYDGRHARAYLNGRLDARGDRNPYAYDLGIFDGGPGGADFTVGAVTRPEKVDDQFRDVGSVVANRYLGLLGGLAVFDRALSDDEMAALGQQTDHSPSP